VAEPVQRLLDGPLAALRNVHKFDPVLRLTLAMGFAHAVSRPVPWPWSTRSVRRSAPACAAGSPAVHRAGPTPIARTPGGAWSWQRLSRAGLSGQRAQFAVAALLVVVAAAPTWLLALRPGQSWTEVPPYWRDAAQWRAATAGAWRPMRRRAGGWGECRWGRAVDEPMQALAGAPWAVRNQIPLGSEGNIRLMDTVSDAISDGRGSPALADY